MLCPKKFSLKQFTTSGQSKRIFTISSIFKEFPPFKENLEEIYRFFFEISKAISVIVALKLNGIKISTEITKNSTIKILKEVIEVIEDMAQNVPFS